MSNAEYVLRMLVAAGHVTQAKVDESFRIAEGLETTVAPEADERDMFELYRSWPADVRAKLSCHDLRRMNLTARAMIAAAPSSAEQPVSARDGGIKGLRVVKKADGVWLNFESPFGRKACLRVESIACDRPAGITRATLLEWAQAFEPGTPPADARDGEDARRYRWLRDHARACKLEPSPAAFHVQGPANTLREFLEGEKLDAAIDRAMGDGT